MGKGLMRQNINIQPELLNVDQVHAYLGGNIGKNRVEELMRENIIPTVQSGQKGLLITRKKEVDDFIDYMFSKKINNKILDTIPLKVLKEFGRK